MSKRSKQLAANVRRRIDHHEPKKLWFEYRPVKASDYLCSLDSYLAKYSDVLVILYGRESTRQQCRKHNLDVLKKVLRGAAEKYHLNVKKELSVLSVHVITIMEAISIRLEVR